MLRDGEFRLIFMEVNRSVNDHMAYVTENEKERLVV